MAKAADPTHADMLEQLEKEAAKGWVPQVGDTILGTVVSVKSSFSNENGNYPIVTLMPDDGEAVAVHCFHQTLKGALLEARPQLGERIAIKYSGKKQSKTRKNPDGTPTEYYQYSLVVDRPVVEDSANWDQFADNTTELPVD